jgi:peptidoglycan hydrolase-like protein with peptidoglycan-binding domain
MNRLSLAILALLLTFTGCASKKYVSQQINPVQAQIQALTDEVVRLDQAVQDSRGSAQGGSDSSGSYSGSGLYRTPSGFELPSLDIQVALKNAGYYRGALDGKIGAGTESAVRAFQRDNGLNADGLVGRNTWSKLKVYLTANK